MSSPLSAVGNTQNRADTFDATPYLEGIAGVFAGMANVIMQLGHPAVGYGVYESPVDSGNAMKRPIKRARTTGTFLAVALLGTDEDRRNMRKAIDSVHRHIRSGPDSPVKYNAFSPELQLWVGACLAKGTFDIIEQMHGLPDDATMELLLQHFGAFATSLQVRPEQWPADMAAFEAYWNEGLAKIDIDDTIRGHLLALLNLENMPKPVALGLRGFVRWVNTGYLPPSFREQMGLSWTARDQRRFRRFMRAYGAVSRRSPQVLRLFPLNLYLWDLRRRVRAGKPIV
ncbi:oxygenase MpaB family protein [Nocardioides sp. Bht2]|uniref:oxygenase MpaB family protein n=1 Tax=Nocardioides sp. Bht2 TaxID=3392297 RepID=UPI0039B5F4F5